jgi:anti-sigma B factor antagonist
VTTSNSQPAIVVLQLGGEIDVATAPNAYERLVAVAPPAGAVVALDLSKVLFIDSRGASMLLDFQEYLDVMGCRFTLVNPSPQVIRVLTMLGLTDTFHTEYGSVTAT